METILQQIGDKGDMTVNHTGILTNPQQTHLVDTPTLTRSQYTKAIHPRARIEDGRCWSTIQSGKDSKQGYQSSPCMAKTKNRHLTSFGDDLMLFDLQDVGVRFYTYISTLTYVMEHIAEQRCSILILDRPNPHDTIDGPVRHSSKYRSFA